MKTQLTIVDVKRALTKLGYYAGAIDDDAMNQGFREQLRWFQRDLHLESDGWYGTDTEGVLLPLVHKLESAPPEMHECRRWHLTYYCVGSAMHHTGPLVPMKKPSGELITKVPALGFAEAALNGSTRIADGRLVSVAHHPSYVHADPQEFAPVYDYAKANGWIPDRAGYAGLQLGPGGEVVGARSFDVRRTGPKGWPVEALGVECDPFRTLAADNGRLPKHDPDFKGKGGVVPAGTRVFILELVGVTLPDGSVHDGWFVVNDTGGGIFGAHFDVFVGTRPILSGSGIHIPARAHIWFEGIEHRLPRSYSYGL